MRTKIPVMVSMKNLHRFVNILITVDTEVWPRFSAPPFQFDDPETMIKHLNRDVYGITSKGVYGLSYQMDVLEAFGLRAVFFVESLFAVVVGIESLFKIVTMIKKRGHEVQLHIHTEWLEWMSEPIIQGRSGRNIKDFNEHEQYVLIAKGLQNLKEAGVTTVHAFRAGNYGADFATLRALARNGISFDTSYNFCYLDSSCGLRLLEPLIQPRIIDNVCEVPISFFSDYPGHHRPAHLCACSFRELTLALNYAWESRWNTFVIVSHSFELLTRRNNKPWTPNRILCKRFENLCRFLAENRSKFQTVGFSQLEPVPALFEPSIKEFKSNRFATMLRCWEQFVVMMQH